MQSEVEDMLRELRAVVRSDGDVIAGPTDRDLRAVSLIETLYRREEAATEQLDKCAALLEVISENAMARDDTVEWSMASVMAKDARALAGDHGQ